MLSTRLLVAADGTRSGVRAALGIAADEQDYQQTLFVARLRAERAPDGTAYERFGDDGPTALLPRGDRHFGVVHAVAARPMPTRSPRSTNAASSRACSVRSAGAWARCSARARAARIRRSACVAQTHHRAARSAGRQRRADLHPIGAQGFNLGLRDALTLAELIGSRATDPGSAVLLDAYARAACAKIARARWRFPTAWRKLTSNAAPLLRPLRSLGLLAMDRSPAAQAFPGRRRDGLSRRRAGVVPVIATLANVEP